MKKINENEGLGMSPRPNIEHQMIMSKLLYFLCSFNIIKNNKYIVVTETELGKPDSSYPDISIWSRHKNGSIFRPLVIFEIVHDKVSYRYSYNTTIANLKEFTSIKEAFIYNYESNEWTKITPDLKETKGDCILKLMNLDLSAPFEK